MTFSLNIKFQAEFGVKLNDKISPNEASATLFSSAVAVVRQVLTTLNAMMMRRLPLQYKLQS